MIKETILCKLKQNRQWWGKSIGFFCGYLLGKGVGALIGLLIGNFFDKSLAYYYGEQTYQSKIKNQKLFFEITFLVMGHIAKADGRVSETEIRLARKAMSEMKLNAEQKQLAIDYYTEGKHPYFNLEKTLITLLNAYRDQPYLLIIFFEIQKNSAGIARNISFDKQKILNRISFDLNLKINHSQHKRQDNQGSYTYDPLNDAYKVLGVHPNYGKKEIKRAYRKLMSQNHPDKLIAQGLPQEMIRVATDKSQKIQKAYDQICEAKGF